MPTFGGVFRDSQVNILKFYVIFLGLDSNNAVELVPLGKGLLIALNQGYEKLVVEGDSLILINMLK